MRPSSRVRPQQEDGPAGAPGTWLYVGVAIEWSADVPFDAGGLLDVLVLG
jgi:hypothetical protein